MIFQVEMDVRIPHDLPAETAFLRAYDAFKQRLSALVDMPDRLVDLLFRFLRQNDGVLSRRAREREFAGLTDIEARDIEAIFAELRHELTVGTSPQ